MQSTHLQNIGKVAAKPAEQIKAGDVLVWNFGSTSEVLAVERTAKTVVVKLSGGYSRRFGASRLVAVQ